MIFGLPKGVIIMGINKKQRDFFHELIRQSGCCRSYQDLSKVLKVSTRSIRNYCQFFEEYLFEMGITNVIKHTTSGITYTGTADQTKQILSRIGESDFYEYHLSPDDRILAIVLLLLDSTVPVTVMELCEALFVSRATLLNDMEKVKLYFQQFHISFNPSTNRGYSLDITESRRQEIICTTCFPYLKGWDILGSEMGTSHFLFENILHLSELLPHICQVIQNAERIYGITITDTIYKQAVFTTSILCKRLTQNQTIEGSLHLDPNLYHISVGNIARFILDALQKIYSFSFGDREILYLAWQLHLCHFDLLQNLEHSVDLYFYMEIQQFLREIENELHCPQLREESFSIMLIRHLWSIRNTPSETDTSMTEDIISYYPDCYQAVKKHIGIIEKCIGRSCTAAELHSILIYVVAEIERQTPKIRKPRAVVLCHTGIGTANFLADRLVETFNLEISEVTTIHRLSEILEKDHYDLLISTIPLKAPNVNCITVSPNLTDADIISIQRALATVQRTKRLNLENQIDTKYSDSRLTELLRPDHIIWNTPCESWQESLKISAGPLLDAKEILPGYLEAIQLSVEKNGPYFVFCPGIALAHAAPIDGVNKFCCSIYKPQTPVAFHHPANDPVKLIIMIGITDAKTQIQSISALMNLFNQESLREQLFSAASPEEMISILFKYC